MLRNHRWVVFSTLVVGLLVTLSLAQSGLALRVAADDGELAAADGGSDFDGTILVGTGRRVLEGVDYVSLAPPEGAIGLNYEGSVTFYDYYEGTYPKVTLHLDVFAPIGKVNVQFSLEWVYSGPAEYYF